MMRMHSVFAVLTILATFSVIVVLRDAGVTRRGGGVGLEEQVVNERKGDNETREEEKRVVSRIETCLLATNVSTYLEERGYLSVAYDNGRNMIRKVKRGNLERNLDFCTCCSTGLCWRSGTLLVQELYLC